MKTPSRTGYSWLGLLDHFWPRLGKRVRQTFLVWRERARQRQALADLDADGLRDIGVTHTQAKREADKPFWRP